MIRFTREQSSVCGLIVVVVFVVALSPAARAQPTFAVLHRFQDPDGVRPWAGLIQGPDGTLYGTTLLGGINQCGTVFQMAPDGSDFSFLYGLTGPDGCNPAANLMQGRDGTLYGTTIAGGLANLGTIFQISPDGAFTLLHSFMGPDGANPQASLIQGFDGMLYGTTVTSGPGAGGTVFQIAPDGTSFTVLHAFAQQDTTDGAFPHGALIQGRDGTLYGTTYQTRRLTQWFKKEVRGRGKNTLESNKTSIRLCTVTRT